MGQPKSNIQSKLKEERSNDGVEYVEIYVIVRFEVVGMQRETYNSIN